MGKIVVRAGSALLALLGVCFAGALAVADTPAPIPKPPLAYSGFPAQISTSSATISAGVNPRGSETSYYLQYGPTASYGAQTQTANAGAGATEVKLTVTLAGLQADTTYHFRMVAASTAGTSFGPDRTLVTKKIPLTLTATVRPNPDVFGSPFSVTGTLAGSESSNQELVLQIDPFPYKQGFADIGNPELSDASGNFSFAVAPIASSAQLRVAALGPPLLYGPILTEHVSLHVSFHLHATSRRGFYRLSGTVAPALAGARVGFQRRGSNGTPINVSGAALTQASPHSSRFARTLRLRHKGLYRVSVQSPTPSLLSNHSHWVRIGHRTRRHR
jgi:hypothetical protein